MVLKRLHSRIDFLINDMATLVGSCSVEAAAGFQPPALHLNQLIPHTTLPEDPQPDLGICMEGQSEDCGDKLVVVSASNHSGEGTPKDHREHKAPNIHFPAAGPSSPGCAFSHVIERTAFRYHVSWMEEGGSVHGFCLTKETSTLPNTSSVGRI